MQTETCLGVILGLHAAGCLDLILGTDAANSFLCNSKGSAIHDEQGVPRAILPGHIPGILLGLSPKGDACLPTPEPWHIG